jgi:hypothetical protein
MPDYKITTNTGHSFIFATDSEIEAQHQFICKALDDFVDDQNNDYGEIIDVAELPNKRQIKKPITSIVCNDNGDWNNLRDCTIIFDVEFDNSTNEPAPKKSSLAIPLEELCGHALKQIMSNMRREMK